MSGTYKNIKDYAFGEHKEAFKKLLEVFNAFSLRYFLIGAQARDAHFFQQGIKPTRVTRDIDFAVMVDTMDHYVALMNALKEKGFEETIDPYRLTWNQGVTIIDILPFGQIAENHIVSFKKWDFELSVLAYREINEELQEFYIDDDRTISVPIPPLHGLFILKLLSWNDKMPGREKDLKDLIQIIGNYWSFVEDEAYEKHLDLFDDNFEINKAAARILGRHLKTTLIKSVDLKTKVTGVLEEQTNKLDPPGLLLQKFASDSDKPIETVKALLDEILNGINE